MPIAHLDDRALIAVRGDDAASFLQTIITADLEALGAGEARPAALLSPQGKILFDFLASRDGADGFLLELRGDVADDLLRRLSLYRLRAKVEIHKLDQQLVAVSWVADSTSQIESTGLMDRRFFTPALVTRHYSTRPAATSTAAAWHRFRIAQGVAESGVDYTLGDAFPHDVLLDQIGGVGFRKGCYVGQEVVSRMQHRGTGRRRVLLVQADKGLPGPGSDVVADGRTLGVLGSVDGGLGLAILRIDRVKEALDAGVPITAGDVPIAVSIPAYATFTFPDAAPAATQA